MENIRFKKRKVKKVSFLFFMGLLSYQAKDAFANCDDNYRPGLSGNYRITCDFRFDMQNGGVYENKSYGLSINHDSDSGNYQALINYKNNICTGPFQSKPQENCRNTAFGSYMKRGVVLNYATGKDQLLVAMQRADKGIRYKYYVTGVLNGHTHTPTFCFGFNKGVFRADKSNINGSYKFDAASPDGGGQYSMSNFVAYLKIDPKEQTFFDADKKAHKINAILGRSYYTTPPYMNAFSCKPDEVPTYWKVYGNVLYDTRYFVIYSRGGAGNYQCTDNVAQDNRLDTSKDTADNFVNYK